ncbi:MAG: hypothetical protein OJF49_002424 [Ktedonobacterales bacterium]|nr:MAG: hypothetical protein OJF49_002424 [Ktedonobacterales bacterium]
MPRLPFLAHVRLIHDNTGWYTMLLYTVPSVASVAWLTSVWS